MAYFTLDILFLIGDPKKSFTLHDNTSLSGPYIVGEVRTKLTKQLKNNIFGIKKLENTISEFRVRIDKTS